MYDIQNSVKFNQKFILHQLIRIFSKVFLDPLETVRWEKKVSTIDVVSIHFLCRDWPCQETIALLMFAGWEVQSHV